MHPDHKSELKRRVFQAAEAALSRQQYVSAIDVLCGMGLLAPTQVASWRKGRTDFLERVIQGNLKKISLSMSMFRQWAQAKGLQPSETGYARRTRSGTVDLQFSKSGDPGIEKSYRTHYVSPGLSERKQDRLKEKLSQAAQPVVKRHIKRFWRAFGASRNPQEPVSLMSSARYRRCYQFLLSLASELSDIRSTALVSLR